MCVCVLTEALYTQAGGGGGGRPERAAVMNARLQQQMSMHNSWGLERSLLKNCVWTISRDNSGRLARVLSEPQSEGAEGKEGEGGRSGRFLKEDEEKRSMKRGPAWYSTFLHPCVTSRFPSSCRL